MTTEPTRLCASPPRSASIFVLSHCFQHTHTTHLHCSSSTLSVHGLRRVTRARARPHRSVMGEEWWKGVGGWGSQPRGLCRPGSREELVGSPRSLDPPTTQCQAGARVRRVGDSKWGDAATRFLPWICHIPRLHTTTTHSWLCSRPARRGLPSKSAGGQGTEGRRRPAKGAAQRGGGVRVETTKLGLLNQTWRGRTNEQSRVGVGSVVVV